MGRLPIVNARVSHQLKRELMTLAKRAGLGRTQVVRLACHEYVQRHRKAEA
jgi:antitoxin component of RelBE/YafQ-DinJ toxin-antitoxin module